MDPELLRFMKKTIVEFGEEFEDNKFVMQFIPIVLMLLLSLYTQRFIEVANSVLGKLLAVVVIIFYTKLNILYGVCACVIIILFYQLTANSNVVITNVFEGMKNPKKSRTQPSVAPAGKSTAANVVLSSGVPSSGVPSSVVPSSVVPSSVVPSRSIPPLATAPLAAAAGTASITCKEDPDLEEPDLEEPDLEDPDLEEPDLEDGTNLPDESNDMDTEGFESYKNLYHVINIEDFNAAKKEFIKEKCRNGVIMYKDMPVKPEMVDHVFSEVHFTTDTKCNPCDRTCAYSIIENKLATEEELGRPKNSNDVFEWFSHVFTKRA